MSDNSVILPEPARRRFAEAWRHLQAEFVDRPEAAITDASHLARELMQTAGTASGNPGMVESYRAAGAVAEINERGDATLEELREAMMHYRSLFGELLADRTAAPEGRGVRQVAVPVGTR
jgi:hypothetical protein